MAQTKVIEQNDFAIVRSSVSGAIERIEAGVAIGWIHDANADGQPVSVQICAQDQVLAEGLANEFRESLANAGIGEGKHGFRLLLEVPFEVGTQLTLSLRTHANTETVAALGFEVTCRHPMCVSARELDDHGVIGQLPVKRRAIPQRRLRKLKARARKAKRLLPLSLRRLFKPLVSGSSKESADQARIDGSKVRLEWMAKTNVRDLTSLPQWPTLTLPVPAEPTVSIIIPVYNQFHITWQCLASLAVHAGKTAFEVILIDDSSTDATTAIESRVENLRIIRNQSNLGFLHSCNKAAAEAHGKYLLFLNNDTEVTAGWLDELESVFDRFEGVGAVGSKLIYPDERLQDAGGIVWNTGVPWNVGHGERSDDPRFNYVRDVDYLTGAALMVSKVAWQHVGGFSAEYAPAYYEDTDLAFKLRDAGYRTLYCPQSTVIHYEGWSNGTSLDSGVKQHQRLNAARFVERWKSACVGNGDEGVDLHLNKDRNRHLRVLMIDNNYPRLGNDAGAYAAVQETRLLQGLGCKVTFLPHNLQHMGKHVDRLQRMGVECIYAPFHTQIDSFLEQRGGEFEVVYITRYAVAEAVLDSIRRFTTAKVVFNNADLHFLRELRSSLARNETDLTSVERTRDKELGVMRRVDAVLSYNETEHHVIASHLLRSDHIFKCPWVLEKRQMRHGFEQRQNIAFLGSFGHPPNREAMDWFIEHVLPELQQQNPAIRLQIWGSSIPEDINWHDDERIDVRGYAPSLDEVFDDCRVFVAPLRSGAGIKGKVLDSISYGVPSVLSPVASEATGLVHGSSTLVARSPEQWVEHIVALHEDEMLWNRISEGAQNLCETGYSWSLGLAQMRHVLESLDLTLPAVKP